DRDDACQPDSGLPRGDGYDGEGGGGRVGSEGLDEGSEGHDREVDGVEHELDRHEHADRVAAGEEAEGPDREQEARKDQVGVERIAHGSPPSSCRARKIPPMTAARSSTLTTSNGRT